MNSIDQCTKKTKTTEETSKQSNVDAKEEWKEKDTEKIHREKHQRGPEFLRGSQGVTIHQGQSS